MNETHSGSIGSHRLSITRGVFVTGILVFIATIINILSTVYNLALLRQLQAPLKEYSTSLDGVIEI